MSKTFTIQRPVISGPHTTGYETAGPGNKNSTNGVPGTDGIGSARPVKSVTIERYTEHPQYVQLSNPACANNMPGLSTSVDFDYEGAYRLKYCVDLTDYGVTAGPLRTELSRSFTEKKYARLYATLNQARVDADYTGSLYQFAQSYTWDFENRQVYPDNEYDAILITVRDIRTPSSWVNFTDAMIGVYEDPDTMYDRPMCAVYETVSEDYDDPVYPWYYFYDFSVKICHVTYGLHYTEEENAGREDDRVINNVVGTRLPHSTDTFEFEEDRQIERRSYDPSDPDSNVVVETDVMADGYYVLPGGQHAVGPILHADVNPPYPSVIKTEPGRGTVTDKIDNWTTWSPAVISSFDPSESE